MLFRKKLLYMLGLAAKSGVTDNKKVVALKLEY